MLCVYFVFEGNFQVQAPVGGGGGGNLYLEGRFNRAFLRYEFGGLIFRGLIHGGAYFLNFTVTKWNPINGLGMADTITTKTKTIYLILHEVSVLSMVEHFRRDLNKGEVD